jgi:hypothetical protein
MDKSYTDSLQESLRESAKWERLRQLAQDLFPNIYTGSGVEYINGPNGEKYSIGIRFLELKTIERIK